MANSSQSTPPAQPRLLTTLAQYRRQTSYGLLAAGALLAVIPVWLAYRQGMAYLAVIFATALLALVPLACGLWGLASKPGRLSEIDLMRLLFLTVGGCAGLALTFVALTLAYQDAWWRVITGGMKAWQGEESWRLWVFLLLQVGGLLVMFISLQLGRHEERSNVMLRRLVYGYNALLTGILLLEALVIINVLASVHKTKPIDFTVQNLYTLSPSSESLLRSLDRPAKVYVILPQGSDLFRRVQALLDNCRDVNSRIQVENLSPDLSRKRIGELQEQYKFSGREGLLVVYGREPNAESMFLTPQALIQGSGSRISRNQEQRLFKGESELMTALNFLQKGKQKPVLYFTQGNDELKLDESAVTGELDVGAGVLKRRLEGDNYVVKGLQLTTLGGGKKGPDLVVSSQVPAATTLTADVDAAATKLTVAGTIPMIGSAPYFIKVEDEVMLLSAGADGTSWTVARGQDQTKAVAHASGVRVQLRDFPAADIVVIAGPRTPFTPQALSALRDYMDKRSGKLFVLLDVPQPGDSQGPLGIEGLLGNYGVSLEPNRILHSPEQWNDQPTWVWAIMNPSPAAKTNPVVAAFQRNRFLLVQARSVETKQGGNPAFNAVPIMVVPPSGQIWKDTNFKTNPLQLFEQLLRQGKLDGMISSDPIPVAVAVTEGTPPIPGHEGLGLDTPSKPRLVVFGDSSLISNSGLELLSPGGGGAYYPLFRSNLDWLDNRSAPRYGDEPKQEDKYTITPELMTNRSRTVLLPAAVMLLGIVGMGSAVWVVRRR